MSSAPLCNITVQTPGAEPTKPKGFQNIPTNASLQQAIQIINNNFLKLAPSINQFFEQFNNVFGGGNWTEDKAQRVTQKMTVTDKQSGAFIEFQQINRVVMEDQNTGAKWTWTR